MNGFGRGEDQQKKEKNRMSVMTRETIGMTLLLFSAVMLFITVTGKYVFGEIGTAITAFFLGLFGFLAYPLFAYAIYKSVLLIAGKKGVPLKWSLRAGFFLVSVFLIVHTATSAAFFGNGYGGYLSGCWNAAAESVKGATAGGVIFGIVVYPIRALLSAAGAYVVFSLLMLLSVFLIVMATPLGARIKGLRRRAHTAEPSEAKSATFDDLEPRRVSATERREAYAEGEAARGREEAPQYDGRRSDDPLHGAYAPQDTYGRGRYAQPAYTTETAYARESVRTSEPLSDYERSREILFGGTSPADSYRENLTFDHDSYYNQRTQQRYGAQQTNTAQAQRQSAQPTPAAAQSASRESESYSERWNAVAETPRPQMPRKVSTADELGSGGYTFNSNDISYPQTPSYRAAEEQKPEPEQEHDYYQNDVPFAEEYSSAPNVYDEPPVPEEKPEEPVRKPAAARRTSASRTSRSSSAESVPTGDNIISGLFSRSTGEMRTVIPDPVEDFSEESDSRGSNGTQESRAAEGFTRNTRNTEDFGRGTERDFGRVEQTESFGRGAGTGSFDRAEEDSRVFDAPVGRRSAADAFDDDEVEEIPEEPVVRRTETERRMPDVSLGRRGGEESETEKPAKKKHVYSKYIAPTPALLLDRDDSNTVSQAEIETNSAIIIDTLKNYKINDAEIVRVTCGATVTRYDVQIPMNIPVNMVTKRSSELAMHLRAQRGVNVYANYEHGAISIEVPNAKPAMVGMKSLVCSDAFLNTKPDSLVFAIGKDIDGRCVCGDVNDMTHILVAGTTGSGKSICLHTLICSMLYKYSPEQLRFILIDPKKNEFTPYEGLPHLMINEVISDAQKAVTAFNWAIKEMERRYDLFNGKTRAGFPCRKIDEYNAKLTEDEERLPKIVVVVDELADLMSVAKKDIEERIQRLAQKARAAGIHLVLATQRPSVDIVTGVIKSNLPTRFALHVQAEIDSRVILDESGAEKLLGHGDLIFTVGGAKRTRAQGAYLTPEETQEIINFVKKHNEAYFDNDVSDYVNKQPSESGAGGLDDEDGGEVDEKYIKALGMVVKLGTASISLIQRKCSVGYNHAGKIVEWMELMGYVSPFDGTSKPRTVLLTQEEYESKYGKLD